MKINSIPRGTIVLGDEIMRIWTSRYPCVKRWKNQNLYRGPLCFTWKKIKFYMGDPLCLIFTTTWESIQGSTIIFLKNIMSKNLKNKGGLSVMGVICGEPECFLFVETFANVFFKSILRIHKTKHILDNFLKIEIQKRRAGGR